MHASDWFLMTAIVLYGFNKPIPATVLLVWSVLMWVCEKPKNKA